MSDFKMETLITSKQAAQWLGISAGTLSNSRTMGKLFGQPAPPHIKVGGAVRYNFKELVDWSDKVKQPITHPVLDWNYSGLLCDLSPKIVNEDDENILIVFRTTKHRDGELVYELYGEKITSFKKAMEEWGDQSITPINNGRQTTVVKWAILTSEFIMYGVESLIKSELKPLTPVDIAKLMNEKVEMFHMLSKMITSETEIAELREKTDALLSEYSELMIETIQEGLNRLNANES
jgi:hypothetical protein